MMILTRLNYRTELTVTEVCRDGHTDTYYKKASLLKNIQIEVLTICDKIKVFYSLIILFLPVSAVVYLKSSLERHLP